MEPFVVIPLELEIGLGLAPQRNKSSYDSFDTFLEKNIAYGIKSTVGYKGSNIIDENVRKSQTIEGIRTNIRLSKKCSLSQSQELKKILPSYLRSWQFELNHILLNNYERNRTTDRQWDLVIYQPHDHFIKHTDGKKSSGHHGTLLLFPPNDFNQFEGGELVFYQSGNEMARIEPNRLTSWTLVAFPINVEHCCLPIQSGTRYVFKSQLYLPEIYQTYYNIPNDAQLLPVDIQDLEEEIEFQQEKIIRYLSKIDKIRNERLEKLSKLIPSNKTYYILRKIQKSTCQHVMVVLDRHYEKPDPMYLIGEDRLLYNEIVKLYPKTKLSNIYNISHNKGDGSDEPNDKLDFDFNWSDLVDIIYQKDLYKGKTPGEVLEENTEYNDSTYDKIVIVNITIISLIKN
jgi:hypothetical protein